MLLWRSKTNYDGYVKINIHVRVNHPPEAVHSIYTESYDINNKPSIKTKVFVNTDCKIKNNSYDNDGIGDIKSMSYEFKDEKNNKYYINLECSNGEYSMLNNTVPSHIVLKDVMLDGSLIVQFATTTKWTMTQTVTDQAGLFDTETSFITPELVSFVPIATLVDQDIYRYPLRNKKFTGKQNRVVAISAGLSQVASFWEGLGVEIDHTKDYIEIIPLDNQDINSIKFNTNYAIEYSTDRIILKNINLKQYEKLMFKEIGKYKIRLRVTDKKEMFPDLQNTYSKYLRI